MFRKNWEQRIHERAYFLWQEAGCPAGRELDFWVQASQLEPRLLWPGRLRTWLASQKDALSTIQAVATVLALVVGGLWTYQIFILERNVSSHVDISQIVTGQLISPEWYWIQLSVTAKNTGKRLVELTTADITVAQIMPLSAAIDDDIKNGKDPINLSLHGSNNERTNWNIPWKGLCRYSIPFSVKIEPEESDTEDVDFIIPTWLKTIGVYTFLKNDKDNQGLGWHAFSIYNLRGSTDDEQKSMAKLIPNDKRLCAYDR
jgi:hypothetical protein